MLKVADICTIDEVNELIETGDANGDGVINYEGKKNNYPLGTHGLNCYKH